MTLVVIEFLGAEEGAPYRDERLETTQFLLAQGCYGEIASPAIEPAPASLWDLLSAILKPSYRLMTAEVSSNAWEQAASLASTDACEYLHMTLAPVSHADFAEVDARLAELLPNLDEDDSLALVGGRAYVIVSANNPLHGATRTVTLQELALTLLVLTEHPRPGEIAGTALFSQPTTSEADEEAELRERFRGLGYIA
jgi:hypothetical protein